MPGYVYIRHLFYRRGGLLRLLFWLTFACFLKILRHFHYPVKNYDNYIRPSREIPWKCRKSRQNWILLRLLVLLLYIQRFIQPQPFPRYLHKGGGIIFTLPIGNRVTEVHMRPIQILRDIFRSIKACSGQYKTISP